MRKLMKAVAGAGLVAGALAIPAFAQGAGAEGSAGAAGDVGARLDALTCSEFLQLEAQDQMTVMLALRAHYNGEALPDEPLPIGLEAELSGDGLAGDSGEAGAEGLDTTEPTEAETAAAVAGVDGANGAGEGADGTDPPDETGLVDGENESGQVNPDGTEASVTDAPADPKLTAMRTSCEGGPEALASNAMIAAHADYE